MDSNWIFVNFKMLFLSLKSGVNWNHMYLSTVQCELPGSVDCVVPHVFVLVFGHPEEHGQQRIDVFVQMPSQRFQTFGGGPDAERFLRGCAVFANLNEKI